ncbi:MAG: SMI1/KNR4 family protein [Sporocytophaga sp.]|uniref:SMI1/KNR4 family protein n=1 Tax=Sporocytophaga sp. TaxID=2231183 RepID=UPI001B2BD80B|nr:SMI1/KNR4 family protein [Sporocytophaga sp.]MBO9703055.1 SMI1/KNR4 family protein [Sporocytophaga sp.]
MSIVNLFRYLKDINHPALSNMKDGLRDDEIQNLENQFNISLPEGLKAAYRIYNGGKMEDKTIGELSVFPNGILLPLEEALMTYNYNKTDNYWPGTYFPIFTSGGGDYLLVQLGPYDDLNRIYFYSPSNVDFETIISFYDDLNTMTDSIIKCYETEVYFVKDGMSDWSLEPLNQAKICKELNPRSEYWKIFISN